jgi:hypothetical protein
VLGRHRDVHGAAHLGATGQLDQLASLCLGVTVLDQAQAGTAAALIDEATATAAMAASARAATWTGGPWPKCSPGCGQTI